MRLSILMPVYNERERVAQALEEVLRTPYPLEREIVVVDDGSTDGTGELLAGWKFPDVRVVRHARNRGKGAALRTAIAEARGDILLVQDADLEYDPRDHAAVLAPILDGRADVVFGNRFHGGPHRVLYFWHRLGNAVVTMAVNVLANMNYADVEVGTKAFGADTIRGIELVSERFGIEVELAVKLARSGARIYEVPISYHGRTYREGKKITWRDGVAALAHAVRFRFAPLYRR